MSKRIRWFPLVGAAFLFLSACDANRTEQASGAPAAERAGVQADVEAIHTLSREWVEGGRAGSADRMASIYAEDAVTFEAGREPLRGRAAIRENYAAMVAAGIERIDAEVLDVEVAESGDLAYELGDYAVSTRTAQGVDEERGRYLAVYRKIDGRWQIVREVSYSEQPAGPTIAQPAN